MKDGGKKPHPQCWGAFIFTFSFARSPTTVRSDTAQGSVLQVNAVTLQSYGDEVLPLTSSRRQHYRCAVEDNAFPKAPSWQQKDNICSFLQLPPARSWGRGPSRQTTLSLRQSHWLRGSTAPKTCWMHLTPPPPNIRQTFD